MIKSYSASGTTSNGMPLKTLRVLLAPGIHRVVRPLEIENWSKLPNGPSLIITGAGQEKTIVIGSVAAPESEWHQMSPSSLVDSAVASNVRMVNYEKLTGRRALPDTTGELFGHELQPVSVSVVFGGRPMALARWPSAGYTTIKDVSEDKDQQTIVHFSDAEPHELPAKGALIAGYLSQDWAYERIPISRDLADGQAGVMAKGATLLGVKKGQRVVVENSLSELDSPNEWYFDGESQELYFWPGLAVGANRGGLELVVANLFLRIKDSNNVRIEALTLQNSLDSAIDIAGSSRTAIDRVTIRNTANGAISIIGGENVTVQNCLLEDIGAGGVYIYGGDRNSLRPGNDRVENCEIRRFAERIKTYQPAIRLEGDGNAAVSNYIHDAPHSAIIYNGNDQLVEANHISDVVLESDDAGAIYTGRDWTARGSVVRNNFLKNIKGKNGAHQAVGLYLDDQASGNTVEQNIFADVTIGVLVGGGRDNVIRNNIFVNNRSSIAVDARGVTWQKSETLDRNWTLWKNLLRMPVDSPAYRKKYPHLADLRSDDLGTPKYDEFHWNLFIASGGIDARDIGYYSWNELENIRLGVDVLKDFAGERRNSPEGYEVIRSKLPTSWPVDYASRKVIPN